MNNVSLFRRLLGLLTALALLPLRTVAAPNPVVVGHARFTVITPLCIRLEFAPNGKFVDNPSLFAANRQARFNAFRLGLGQPATVDSWAPVR